jgi:hypothetical protein
VKSSRALAGRTALLVAAIAASPLLANTPTTHEAEIAKCIRQSAHGRKWLEMTLWGLRDQEGGWAGAEVRNADGSADLGPLQVNSWWVPRFAEMTGRSPEQVRRWLIADICFNIDAGRWIFLTGLQATGNYWSAIGTYHSPTLSRRHRYAAEVAQKLVRRFGPRVFDLSASPRTGATMETPK